MVKVHYTRKYLRSIREAQRINSDVRAKGSVEQNRGSTERNLIQRLYKGDEVAKQTKVQKIHVTLYSKSSE